MIIQQLSESTEMYLKAMVELSGREVKIKTTLQFKMERC